MAWSRDTPWRQGHLLGDDAIEATGLRAHCEPGLEYPLVVSHDCDLAAEIDKEPEVEVLVAKRIPESDGNLTRAKNPRRLHLEVELEEGVEAFEISALRKHAITKQSLEPFAPLAGTLPPASRATLQVWLSGRYRRAAFPNAFETRLSSSKLQSAIAKAVKKSSDLVVAILADLDEGEEIERDDDNDIYSLGLIVLYDGSLAGARKTAEDVAAKIEDAFEAKLLVSGQWKLIRLLYCDAVSDEVMTVAQAELLKQLPLDYLSLEEQ